MRRDDVGPFANILHAQPEVPGILPGLRVRSARPAPPDWLKAEQRRLRSSRSAGRVEAE